MTDRRRSWPENSVESSIETSDESSVETAKAPNRGQARRVSAGQASRSPETPESRLPKGSYALRSRSRPAPDELRSVVRHLTGRDRDIALTVSRHRVFTTDQLTEMFFDNYKTAAKRLRYLVSIGVLDRFQPNNPRWGGSQPFHYVVGPIGAAVEATERGGDADRAARRWRADRALALARTQRLAHLVGVNGVFASLSGRARSHDAKVVEWLTESEAARWTEGIVRPDAFVRWRDGGSEDEFFIEYDRGTEALRRLAAKLPGYERFEAERGTSAFVLFAFPSERRERAARRALDCATVPIATAALDGGRGPAGAVWMPLGRASDRLRLAEVARVPKPEEAERRAISGGLRAWYFDRSRTDDEEEAPIEPY